jgi:hypothetical protein
VLLPAPGVGAVDRGAGVLDRGGGVVDRGVEVLDRDGGVLLLLRLLRPGASPLPIPLLLPPVAAGVSAIVAASSLRAVAAIVCLLQVFSCG